MVNFLSVSNTYKQDAFETFLYSEGFVYDDIGKTGDCTKNNSGFIKRREFFGETTTSGNPPNEVSKFTFFSEAINFQAKLNLGTGFHHSIPGVE